MRDKISLTIKPNFEHNQKVFDIFEEHLNSSDVEKSENPQITLMLKLWNDERIPDFDLMYLCMYLGNQKEGVR